MVILWLRKIVLHSRIIQKTQTIKNQEISEDHFGEIIS